MRVGYFTNQYPAVSHTFIRREIQALESDGVDVVRYALRAAPHELVDIEDLQEEKITRYVLKASAASIVGSFFRSAIRNPKAMIQAAADSIRIGWRSDRGLLRHFVYLVEAAILSEWCRRDHVAHLHAHFGTNPAVVALLSARLSGMTYSFTAHGCEEFEKAPLMSLDYKLARAAFAVCVSAYGRSQLMRWSDPKHWSKIHVVHCGVDSNFLDTPTPPIPEEPHFVCVGRLGEHKAQLVLVSAVGRLASQGMGCKVTMVGDGPMRPQVEAKIRELALSDHIAITGWVSGDRVRNEILSSRALILPSFAENMPVVIMEAFALGRPVISTFIAGIPELVSPGGTGWLVPAGDDQALAEAMRAALSTSAERLSEMGRAGRQHILKHHDAYTEAMKMKALFASVGKQPETIPANTATPGTVTHTMIKSRF